MRISRIAHALIVCVLGALTQKFVCADVMSHFHPTACVFSCDRFRNNYVYVQPGTSPVGYLCTTALLIIIPRRPRQSYDITSKDNVVSAVFFQQHLDLHLK